MNIKTIEAWLFSANPKRSKSFRLAEARYSHSSWWNMRIWWNCTTTSNLGYGMSRDCRLRWRSSKKAFLLLITSLDIYIWLYMQLYNYTNHILVYIYIAIYIYTHILDVTFHRYIKWHLNGNIHLYIIYTHQSINEFPPCLGSENHANIESSPRHFRGFDRNTMGYSDHQ